MNEIEQKQGIKIRQRFPEVDGLDNELVSLLKQIEEKFTLLKGKQDIEIGEATKGVIFTDSDGIRWRQTVNTSGTAVITELT